MPSISCTFKSLWLKFNKIKELNQSRVTKFFDLSFSMTSCKSLWWWCLWLLVLWLPWSFFANGVLTENCQLEVVYTRNTYILVLSSCFRAYHASLYRRQMLKPSNKLNASCFKQTVFESAYKGEVRQISETIFDLDTCQSWYYATCN